MGWQINLYSYSWTAPLCEQSSWEMFLLIVCSGTSVKVAVITSYLSCQKNGLQSAYNGIHYAGGEVGV